MIKNSFVIKNCYKTSLSHKAVILCSIFYQIITISGGKHSHHHIKLTQRNNHANISELLDNLLRGYDNSIRPDFGGSPAIVEVDIMVRSMGPISEVDMTYSMDCYFRQSWVDKRLAFKGAQDTLALSISMLARIWKPDTYFYNGKQSYLHTITTPNKFVRIYQDGRVLYSSRLTIKAGCPMNLEDFPMDIQRCPLKFGSFGYTTKDVIYRWNGARQAVAIAEDMKLSQFDLVDCPAGNSTDTMLKTTPINLKSGTITETISLKYSMLTVNFHLKRHMGNFLIQVYGPCCLLVVLSWVSFWLNREATADRVSLGITTVLTMTFLGLEARTDLPKVPYLTALDCFVFLSFAFIFATILQFAFVHYFTKYGSGECYFIIDQYDSESESDTEQTGQRRQHHQKKTSSNKHSGGDDDDETMHIFEQMSSRTTTIDLNDSTDDSKIFEVIPLSTCSVTPEHLKRLRKHSPHSIESSASSSSWFKWNCFKRKNKTQCSTNTPTISEESTRIHRKRSSIRLQSEHSQFRRRRKRNQPKYNSVSKIDITSRIVFPLLFLIINVFYWCAYLLRSSRWVPTSQDLAPS